MANEAHKEPTMEEILASIRKIISDDDVPTPEVSAEPSDDGDTFDEVFADADNDDFDSLLAEDVLGDDVIDETIFAEEETIEEVMTPSVSKDAIPEPASFDEMISEPREEKSVEPDFAEPEAVSPPPVDTFTEPEPIQATESKEADMAATAKYEQTVLTEEKTADAAAGALGKLISKMDFGGDNTIEGLVREMLKPMIKDWLDANLPGIVEEKVEAEVQRIARMAR